MKIDEKLVVSDLYKNINTQNKLGNKLSNYRKGTIVVKKRCKEEYYYLSYREKNKVKTDYLGKLTPNRITRLKNEIEEANDIRRDLKLYQDEEKELRKLIKVINPNILKKNIYEIVDLIVILKPIFKEYGLKKVYLFGSYARHTADENSNINIATDIPKKPIEGLIKKINKETGKSVNIVTPETVLPIEYLENIEKDKILIYGGY